MGVWRQTAASGHRGCAFVALQAFVAVLFGAFFAQTAGAQGLEPGFSKSFTPDTIGPGSTSVLEFRIDNSDSGSPVTDLAFTDVLPAGVTIAASPNASTTCGGSPALSAPAGGTTITFSDGTLGAFDTCTIAANVTSSTPGTHTNTSDDLTSSAGTSGSATADLTVDGTRPGFSKAFSPSSIGLGAVSTLTFTIDNSAGGSSLFSLSFSDDLPSGMNIASPANASTTCASPVTFSAPAGGSSISFLANGPVEAGATCTVSVDITGTALGAHDNISGELLYSTGGPIMSAGVAADTLTVASSGELQLTKAFTDDPVIPGDTVTLRFTLRNTDRDATATGITFTDDLDATLSGLAAVTPLPTDPCGAGSTLSTTPLTLTGGTLGPSDTCTFDVTLQVPAGAGSDIFPNTTSPVTADGGLTGDPASDNLNVQAGLPLLTKTFTTNPVLPEDAVTLEFTITNQSTTDEASDFSFTDNLEQFISGTQVISTPSNGFCGAGSAMGTVSIGGELNLAMSGGSLPASDSCTFSVDLAIPSNTPDGAHTNTTSEISATVDGSTVVGLAASDSLTVQESAGRIGFSKSFAGSAVPGGTTTLEFTLTNNNTTTDATGIAFTDDLDAMLTGTTVSGLPSNPCGAGSSLGGEGTGVLSLTGGTLAAGASCTFSATVNVDGAAATGDYLNTTSVLTATVDGNPSTGGQASDTLTVLPAEPPVFTKSFTDDPVIAGDTVTLRFTVDNSGAGTGALTDLSFQDNLSGVLSGLEANGLPLNDICGTGSQISGTTTLNFSGGNLAAGGSCTFDVTLQVPAGAASGDYGNATSDLAATIDGLGPVLLPPATDSLSVNSDVLLFSKSFTDDPIPKGGTGTLEFTIENTGSVPVSSVGFADDLDAVLTGLVVVGLPQADVCGAGSQISGTSLLSLTGGSVAAGSSCTFSVTVQVPDPASTGDHTNTTSQITGEAGGLPVSGLPATDDLTVVDADALTFSKTFNPGSIIAGGVSTLTFTIDNGAARLDATALDFTDSMPPPMIVARDPNASTTCTGGTLSATSGSGVVSYSGGTVSAGASCTVSVDVTVVDPGSYDNVSGDLTSSLGNSGPASDTLEVTIPGNPPPLFSKAFAPDTILPGDISTLTFTIDNGAASLDATDLDFTDDLSASLGIAGTPNAATTCTGGTLSAPGGGTQISYTGGTVAGGAVCIVRVDVTAEVAGRHDNVSGDLTSSLGNSGPATATLNAISGAPAFSKAFAPDTIVAGEVSTLTFTIDNTAATLAATNLDFTDPLPGTVVVAAAPNASTTCTGGTLTAAAGGPSIAYSGGTIADGALCTVMVDVTAAEAGTYVNETGDLTSSLGNSGPATDTLTVNERTADLSVTLVDDIDPIVSGNQLTYTADASNAGPQAADNTVATVALPPGTTFVSSSGCAEDPNGVPTCNLGSIPAGGSASFSYTVLVDIGTSGSISSDVSVASDVTDTNSSNNDALQSTTVNQASGTITVMVNTAPAAAGDYTFEFTSPDADLDAASLTTVSNTATTDPIAKVAGSYPLSQDVPATWRLDAIECTGDTDGGSVIDTDENEVTIDLDDGEAIVCTFTNIRDEDYVIAETQGLIREFMEQRADQITSNSPDLVKRLRGRGGGGTLGTLQGSANLLSSNFFLSSSLGEVKSFRNSLNGEGTTEPPKFDMWVDARFTHNKTDSSSTHFGLLYLGADYLVNPDLVIGGIVQLDWAGLDRNATNQSVDGFGWMAGPYFVARPWQDVYIDGRFAWGQSENEVNPLGLYVDSFDTERWLASGRITGDYFHGGLRISPAAEVIYFHERQEAYVDSLSITIPSQTVSLGRVVFGPEIAYEMQLASGAVLTPSFKFEGIWDFHRSDSAASSMPFTSTSELRARVGVGLGFVVPRGMTISASGFYDGIGASSYDTYGGKIEVSVPLN